MFGTSCDVVVWYRHRLYHHNCSELSVMFPFLTTLSSLYALAHTVALLLLCVWFHERVYFGLLVMLAPHSIHTLEETPVVCMVSCTYGCKLGFLLCLPHTPSIPWKRLLLCVWFHVRMGVSWASCYACPTLHPYPGRDSCCVYGFMYECKLGFLLCLSHTPSIPWKRLRLSL